MTSRNLRQGDVVSWHHHDARVKSITRDHVELEHSDGAIERVSIEDFTRAGTTSVQAATGTEPDELDLSSIAEIPPAALAEAETRRDHIHELIHGVPYGQPDQAPRPQYAPHLRTGDRLDAKVRELTDLGWKISHSTLRRWVHDYEQSGLLGLVDRRHVRKPQPFDTLLLDLCAGVLASVRESSTLSVANLCTRARHQFIASHPGRPCPSERTLRRVFESLGYQPRQSAASRRSQELKPKGSYRRTSAVRPGEQVQIDSTPLDVLVLDDSGKAVRSTLSLMIDVATMTICASLIRPSAPKAFDHCLLLAMALFPDHFRTRPPSVVELLGAAGIDIDFEHQTMPFIIPETLTRDNGKDYRAATTEAAMLRYGITVHNAAPYTPTSKPVVERTFGSINKLFCSFLDSYVGTDPANRGQRREEHALPLDVVNVLFDVFVRDVWQQRKHEGLRNPFNPSELQSPNQRFEALSSVAPTVPIPISQYEFYELLPVEFRKARLSGIELNKRTYRSEDLTDYINRHRLTGSKIPVRYNPRDPSTVYVRTEPGDWITAVDRNLGQIQEPFAALTWVMHRPRLSAIDDAEARARVLAMAQAAEKQERQAARNAQIMSADAHMPRLLDEPAGVDVEAAPAPDALENPDAFEPFATSADQEW